MKSVASLLIITIFSPPAVTVEEWNKAATLHLKLKVEIMTEAPPPTNQSNAQTRPLIQMESCVKNAWHHEEKKKITFEQEWV